MPGSTVWATAVFRFFFVPPGISSLGPVCIPYTLSHVEYFRRLLNLERFIEAPHFSPLNTVRFCVYVNLFGVRKSNPVIKVSWSDHLLIICKKWLILDKPSLMNGWRSLSDQLWRQLTLAERHESSTKSLNRFWSRVKARTPLIWICAPVQKREIIQRKAEPIGFCIHGQHTI